MTDDTMDQHRSRTGVGGAVVLGGIGSLGAGALGALLTVWATRQWPGWQVAHVADGLGFLSTLGAAVASGWVAVLLARAVLCLLTDRGGPEGESVLSGPTTGSGTRWGPSPAVRQVATGLLAVGALLATPVVAGATETVVTSQMPSHASGSGGASSSTPEQSVVTAAPAEVAAAGATEVEATPDGSDRSRSALPRPGWTPTLLPAAPRPSADVGLVSATTRGGETVDHVVVHRGDTLWDIAARHLGQQATDQDVAEEWPRWYAKNRDVIGDDPHLLRPGQQLAVPAPEAHR